MEQKTENTKQRRPKGIKIILGLSLALNLAVIGVVAGAMLRKGPEGPHRAGGDSGFARPYIQALPREMRRAVFEATRSPKTRLGRVSRRQRYQEVIDILRVEKFDRVAIEVVLAKQAAETLNAQGAGQVQWLNVIENMGAEERRNYADAIEEVLNRKPARKRKPKSD